MGIQEIFNQNLKYISKIEADVDTIKRQFVKSEKRFYLTIGTVDLPTGRIVIGDPLAYLYMGKTKYCPMMEYAVEPGEYKAEVALCRSRLTGIRMCTVRLKIKATEAVAYERAMSTEDTAIGKAADGLFSGISVEAGMIAICDARTANQYAEFIEQWHEDNPDKNHYDDYFAHVLKESVEKMPQFQREDGDFTEWAIPDSGYRMVMVSSGFGDGFYQAFWGRDKDGELCELIVPLVNPDIIDAAEEEYDNIWSGPSGCIATKRVTEDGCKVRYMYREQPYEGVPDSGWRFFEGTEDDAYVNNLDNSVIVDIHDIAEDNPEIIPLLKADYGTAYFREENGEFVKESIM